MSRTTKLILDLVIGAVIPIVVLTYLSEPLGAVPAYIIAALIPVGWVFLDLLFITRRFNFITSYVGVLALARGLLAFWFVDGWRFALKDSAGSLLATLLFGGSILLHRPMMELWWAQTLAPDTPEREQRLSRLARTPQLHRGLVQGTLVVMLANIVSGIANFLLNLRIVTAAFGTDAFNSQVAQVNAITRVALTIVEMGAYFVGFWLIFRALAQTLGRSEIDGLGDELWAAIDAHEPAGERQKAGGERQEAGGGVSS